MQLSQSFFSKDFPYSLRRFLMVLIKKKLLNMALKSVYIGAKYTRRFEALGREEH